MNPDPENFEQLRRLLALKRHEQPPPGYFDGFSKQVISGIREARKAPPTLAQQINQIPWLARLFASLETKPLFAGAFGAGVCALLISGILYSERMELPSGGSVVPLASETPNQPNTRITSPLLDKSAAPIAMNQSLAPALGTSTNPLVPAPSLFDQIPFQAQVQPASFSTFPAPTGQ